MKHKVDFSVTSRIFYWSNDITLSVTANMRRRIRTTVLCHYEDVLPVTIPTKLP